MADPVAMHDPDYQVPLRKVNEWMASPDGVSQETVDSIDRYFEDLAHVTPRSEQIVFEGMPWGGLEESAFGVKLSNGTWFNLSITDETRPWVELSVNGTFTTTTLERTPLNFEVNSRWLRKLEESVETGHKTWLHALFLGTQALEVGNVARAGELLSESLELKPNPIAARNLATFAEVDSALAYYKMAWVCQDCPDSTGVHVDVLCNHLCRPCGKKLTRKKTLQRCCLAVIWRLKSRSGSLITK